MSYNLFLDDIRNPNDCIHYMKNKKKYIKWDWKIVRTYDEFVKYIKENGMPENISFDHDLSYEHYNYQGCEIPYDKLTEKTGYDCAKWLINYCIDNEMTLPKGLFVHSMNVIGGENINQIFKSYIKSLNY